MNKVALITNSTKYAGPGAVSALLNAGFTVMCQDESFAHEGKRIHFEKLNPGIITCLDKTPAAIVATTIKTCGHLDLLVSNDVFPLQYLNIDEVSADIIREVLETLFVWPFCLIGKAAAQMKKQKQGNIILITSAAPNLPVPGFSIYSSIRASASALSRSAARELAPFNITVNAIAPNYFENETYYPSELWESKESKIKLANSVPMGRLGRPDEIGALIAFLASGSAEFLTGEVINFTGGWP